MEDQLSQARSSQRSKALAQNLSEQRRRALEFLAAQKQRLDQLETRLTDQVRTISEEFGRSDSLAAEREALHRQSEELQKRAQEFTRLKEDLERRQADWEVIQEHAEQEYQLRSEHLQQLHQELQQRQTEIGTAETRLRHDQRELTLARDEHQLEAEQLAKRRARIDELEKKLEVEREELETECAETKGQRRRIASEFKSQRATLLKELEQRRAELERLASNRQTDTDQNLAALRQEREELQKQLDSQREEIETLRVQLEEQSDRLHHSQDELRHQLEEKQHELEAQQTREEEHSAAQLHERKEAEGRLQEQCDRLAAERSQLSQQVAELEQARDHLQHTIDDERNRLETERADQYKQATELRNQRDRLQSELDNVRKLPPAGDKQTDSLLAELQEAKTQVVELTLSLEQVRKEAINSAVAAEANAGAAEADSVEADVARLALEHQLDDLRAEKDLLVKRLANADAQLTKTQQSPANDQATRDLQRRFELAVEDVRDLKRRNSELEDKLSRARTAEPGASGDSQAMDWEARKRQFLASLEADPSDDPHAAAERLTIEGTIRITDEVVARKDEEISQLLQRLAEYEQQGADGPISHATVEIINQDELVQAERAKLQKLQDEWREKVRQAEIDISIERAKIARERAAIEDKLQSYEAEKARHQTSGEPKQGPDGMRKPSRGRWLSRLGLTDSEER